MSVDAPVKYLEWDSDFFSARIGHIENIQLTPQLLATVDKWSAHNLIDCLYFLADATDSESVRCAEDSGFRLTDLRVTLDISIESQDAPWQTESPFVRLSQAADIPLLRAIASTNHSDSRFYHDGRFPKERCDELYATWIENSCNGFADAVLVADKGEGAVGYISCHLRGGGIGQIGLVGVGESCRGGGVGRQLVSESLKWFASSGVNRVIVVTQGRNTGAQRLYQKCGFMTCSIGLWYHRWYVHESRSRSDAGPL